MNQNVFELRESLIFFQQWKMLTARQVLVSGHWVALFLFSHIGDHVWCPSASTLLSPETHLQRHAYFVGL